MMRFHTLAVVVAGLTTFFISGAETAPCPPSTAVEMDVATIGDLQKFTDALNCTGPGGFSVTWYSSLLIERTIEVSSQKNVTITGSGFHTIRAAPEDDNDAGTGIFYVSDGSSLRLNNLVLEGGSSEHGGAVVVLSSSYLHVVDCIFTNNKASRGGAVYADSSAIRLDRNSSFVGNSAGYGGALYVDLSNVSMDGNTTFKGNYAESGGGAVYALSSGVRMYGSTHFSSNNATGGGGAVYAGLSDFYMNGTTAFSGNYANLDGGALFADKSTVSMDGINEFSSNYANDSAGAVYAESSNVSMQGGTEFKGNHAYERGGAVYATQTQVSINGSTVFSGNVGGFRGGGVSIWLAEIYLNGTTHFSNNSASWYGGGIHVWSGEVYMDGRTEFVQNAAGLKGGAVQVWGGEVHVRGSTDFVVNTAGEKGGAVYLWVGDIYIDGNTVLVNNSAGLDGGAVHSNDAVVYLNGSTDFVGNSAPRGGAIFSTGQLGIAGSVRFTRNAASVEGGALWAEKSEVGVTGSVIFTQNTAFADGGAIYGSGGNFSITGFKESIFSGETGALYSVAGPGNPATRSVAFINNSAAGLGGAMLVQSPALLQVSGATFRSNQAALGGAVYLTAVEDKETAFSACDFEGNLADDGGAFYLYTGPGVDVFTESVFKNNFASVSGGAIFHTGSLHVVNSSFVGNRAGIEGAAVMSIGFLEIISNVSFLENTYYCGAGEYGYAVKSEDYFCSLCFDEVCSRCSTDGDDVTQFEQVRTDGLPVCAKPPSGATASSKGTTVETLTLEKGYYRTSNQSHDVIKCYEEKACLGGSDTATDCASGYEGPYCAVCAEGFAPGVAYSCRECSGDTRRSAVGITTAVALAALLVAALLFGHLGHVVHNGAGEGREAAHGVWRKKWWSCLFSLGNMLPLTAIKIVVTVWQILYQFDAIAGDVYPEVYKKFVSKLSPVNLDMDFILSYSCVINTDFYDHLLVVTIAPPLVLVLFTGSYLLAKHRNSRSASAVRAVLHKHQAAALYVAFLVYSPVSYKIFQTFACDELDDGNAYLRADYSVSCLTPRHAWYQTYALIMVVAYPVDIAAVFAWLLFRQRGDLVKPNRETLSHLRPIKGMWGAYKPSRYYFEVVECGRRAALIAIAAFIPHTSMAQIAIALFFAVVFVFLSEAIAPFEKSADIGLYRWGNGIIVTSLYVAFLREIDIAHDTAQASLAFSRVLIAANVVMVVTVLIQAALLVKKGRKVREIGPVRRTFSGEVSQT